MLKASIVINTYNRADYLENSMRSIFFQSYPAVELVVVNGPSTDATEVCLTRLADQGLRFKIANCRHRNLSESRNIGIANASGDVVFFIDDDAIAHPEWVTRIMQTYSNGNVGGAGGFTFDHTGMAFQCKYTVCDREGNARFYKNADLSQFLENSSGFHFPSLLGTNSSFRRSELEAIDGFDEVFEYMLDETDVCLEIFKRKKKIVTVPDAYVFHKYAPSHLRTVARVPASLRAPARSKAYFLFKHWADVATVDKALSIPILLKEYKKEIAWSNLWHLDHGNLTPSKYSRLNTELEEGIVEGVRLGLSHRRGPRAVGLHSHTTQANLPFKMISSTHPSGPVTERLVIYFISQGVPPSDTSGIARWTYECAKALTILGHEVHIICRSSKATSYLEYEKGIWIHAIIDSTDEQMIYASPVSIPDSTGRRATAVLNEISRARAIWGIDIVSAPIWDVEGILCQRYLDVPVITSLHTTYLLALPFKDDWKQNHGYRKNHVEKVIRGERWLLSHSKYILANSNEVVNEIDRAYTTRLANHSSVIKIPHGLSESLDPSRGNLMLSTDSAKIRVLYVGRIEPRKGLDLLLKGILSLPVNRTSFDLHIAGKWPHTDDEYSLGIRGLLSDIARIHTDLKISLHGYITDADLLGLYRSTDIFVAPSRFESFGLVLLEAMRESKPVIAGNIGGMREVIDDAKEGFLVDLEKDSDFGDKVALLAENEELRKQMGQAARQRFEREFSSLAVARQLEIYYRGIIKMGHQP